MFKQLKNPLKFGSILLVSIILTLGFSLSLQSLLATWTAPNSTPPDSNIEDFLVGGGLGVAGNMSVGGNSTLALSSDRRVGIGTSTPKAKLDIFSTSTDDLFAVRDSVNDPTPFMIKQDGRVGIGTSTPSVELEVVGKIKTTSLQVAGGTPVNGKVLTSDAFGNATWGDVDSDSVIGNEIRDVADDTLIRTGTGTSISPFKIALNLTRANTWTNTQTIATSGTHLILINNINPHGYIDSNKGVQIRLDNDNNDLNSNFQINNGNNDVIFKMNKNNSLAVGKNSSASGNYAIAMGNASEATGVTSFAVGHQSKANGEVSVAMGQEAKANGYHSVAIGENTIAGGERSTAIGYHVNANNKFSLAMGNDSSVNGDYGIAIGNNVSAQAEYATAMGRWNKWENDTLFVIGNGTDSMHRSNALMVLKNGNVGIGTSNPSYKLDVNGKINGSELCIGGNCKNTWPGVYSAGTGLSLLNGVFSIDDSVVQKRVASNCSAGSSIRAINQNGTVVCETDNTGSSWPTGNYCIFKNGGSCPSGFTQSQLNLLVGTNAHDHCEGAPKYAGASSCTTAWGSYVSRQVLVFCCK